MKYDVIVVGAGPGGYVCAIKLAQMGKKVCVMEMGSAGGTCLNTGCIPTKVLVSTAGIYRTIKKSADFGIFADNVTFNWERIQERRQRIISSGAGNIFSLLKGNGVDFIKGKVKVVEKGKVTVEIYGAGSKIFECENIVIATGSIPVDIKGIEIDEKDIISSESALSIEKIPESILIVGAGVIGVEFAGIFNIFGAKVTIVEILERILPTEDIEIADFLMKQMIKDGIQIKTGYQLKNVEKKDGKLNAIISSKDKEEMITVEKILIAVGRKPWTGNIEFKDVSIRMEKNRIITDESMRTDEKNIYAIGDVTGGVLLAHVASAEGIVAAENIAGINSKIDYRIIPNCIFSFPEVASVGLTEEKAKNSGYRVRTGKFPFLANGRAITMGEGSGFVKTVIDEETDAILGIHMVGPEVTELIMQGCLALKMEAISEEFKRIIYAHPTLSEAILESVHDAYGKAVDIIRRKT